MTRVVNQHRNTMWQAQEDVWVRDWETGMRFTEINGVDSRNKVKHTERNYQRVVSLFVTLVLGLLVACCIGGCNTLTIFHSACGLCRHASTVNNQNEKNLDSNNCFCAMYCARQALRLELRRQPHLNRCNYFAINGRIKKNLTV